MWRYKHVQQKIYVNIYMISSFGIRFPKIEAKIYSRINQNQIFISIYHVLEITCINGYIFASHQLVEILVIHQSPEFVRKFGCKRRFHGRGLRLTMVPNYRGNGFDWNLLYPSITRICTRIWMKIMMSWQGHGVYDLPWCLTIEEALGWFVGERGDDRVRPERAVLARLWRWRPI